MVYDFSKQAKQTSLNTLIEKFHHTVGRYFQPQHISNIDEATNKHITNKNCNFKA